MSSFVVKEGRALVESAHHRGELAVEKGAGHEMELTMKMA